MLTDNNEFDPQWVKVSGKKDRVQTLLHGHPGADEIIQ